MKAATAVLLGLAACSPALPPWPPEEPEFEWARPRRIERSPGDWCGVYEVQWRQFSAESSLILFADGRLRGSFRTGFASAAGCGNNGRNFMINGRWEEVRDRGWVRFIHWYDAGQSPLPLHGAILRPMGSDFELSTERGVFRATGPAAQLPDWALAWEWARTQGPARTGQPR